MKNSLLRSICLAVSICHVAFWGVTTAHAQFTLTTPAAFEGQLQPGFFLQDFENLTPATGSQGTSITFSGPVEAPTFTYTISTPTSDAPENVLFAGVSPTPYSHWLGTFFDNEPITITFTLGTVTAVGANYFLTDLSGPPVPIAGSLSISITTVGPTGGPNTQLITSAAFPNPPPFLGFTAAPGDHITSLTIAAPGFGNVATLDNLVVGTAVPEPSQWGTCFGVLGLVIAGVRRWRIASSR